MKGLGNDIIEIERIRKSIDRHSQHFLDRLFTLREQDYCLQFKDPVPHFAGRFAAKEAISKAFGTGFGSQLHWHEFEILSEDSGKPKVIFSQELQSRFQNPIIFLSISHCELYATAIAAWI